MALPACFLIIWMDFLTACGNLWQIFLHVVWRINGVGAKRDTIWSGKEKVYTAQVLTNWYTVPCEFFATRGSFITTHSHFTPASIVLKPDVHMLGIDGDTVRFIELNPDLDIFNVRENPFLHSRQTFNTKRVIDVPRHVFDQLVDDVDIDDKEVVWLFHTCRCGSTLWSQIFALLPKWTVLSEPQTMFYTVARTNQINDVSALSKTAEYEDWVVACVKMNLRLAPKGNSVFWKTTIIDDHIVPIIRKRFPSHKLLFAYRDAFPSATSYFKAFGMMPVTLNILTRAYQSIHSGNFLPQSLSARTGWMFYTNGYDPVECGKVAVQADIQPNAFEFFILLWSVKISMIENFRKDGINFEMLKYEDLLKGPSEFLRELFVKLDISLDLIDMALGAMGEDSQAGAMTSEINRAGNDSWQLSPEADHRCNHVLKALGMPDLHTPILL